MYPIHTYESAYNEQSLFMKYSRILQHYFLRARSAKRFVQLAYRKTRAKSYDDDASAVQIKVQWGKIMSETTMFLRSHSLPKFKMDLSKMLLLMLPLAMLSSAAEGVRLQEKGKKPAENMH